MIMRESLHTDNIYLCTQTIEYKYTMVCSLIPKTLCYYAISLAEPHLWSTQYRHM
jgi:hypothetical protein